MNVPISLAPRMQAPRSTCKVIISHATFALVIIHDFELLPYWLQYTVKINKKITNIRIALFANQNLFQSKLKAYFENYVS